MLKLSELRKRNQPLKYRRIAARVTDAEHALIQQAADLQGQSLSGFVLATLQREAMQVIETMEMVRGTASESGEPGEVLPGAPRDEGQYLPGIEKRNLKTGRSKRSQF